MFIYAKAGEGLSIWQTRNQRWTESRREEKLFSASWWRFLWFLTTYDQLPVMGSSLYENLDVAALQEIACLAVYNFDQFKNGSAVIGARGCCSSIHCAPAYLSCRPYQINSMILAEEVRYRNSNPRLLLSVALALIRKPVLWSRLQHGRKPRWYVIQLEIFAFTHLFALDLDVPYRA